MDHLSKPPHYYVSNEEIEEALDIWGPITGIQREPSPKIPRPVGPVPPPPPSPRASDYALDQAMARISPTPVPVFDAIVALQTEATQSGIVAQGDPASADELFVVRAVFNYAPPFVPGVKPSKKLQSMAKMLSINLNAISRVEFIESGLRAHSLSQTFSPGVVSGPPIKLYWTGSAGGKSQAATILNDSDFSLNKAAIFRKKQKPEVTMEFTASELEPFRIQDAAAQALILTGSGDENQELAYGTHVPQASSFNTTSQMHGMYMLELKKKYPCETHLGEHGDPGYCYVSANGTHVRLSPYRLKLWAAAWAAGDTTKHEPPNVDAFDGSRNANEPPVKPRGRGRGCSDVGMANNNNDITMAMLVGALLGRKRARSESTSPRARQDLQTPQRASSSRLSIPLSPLPIPGDELSACLAAFFSKDGIDFQSYVPTLSSLDLTPDVIPAATDSLLMDLLGSNIGKVLKLKVFCERWTARQGKKRDVFT